MTQATLKKPAETATTVLDRRVTPESVAARFGISVEQMSGYLGTRAWPELRYRQLEGEERDAIMLGILKRIQEGALRVVGGNDNTVWQKGWGEILAQVQAQGFTPAILRPQYFDHHRIMRLDSEYIDGGDANFVYEYDQLLRRLVIAHYLKGQKHVVELGCGTGTSQLILAELLPDAQLTASDWAEPSQEIIRAIGAYLKRDIKPVNFNMLTLEGWNELGINSGSAVLTVHALEQLGDGCGALLDKLVAAKPKLCVHFEPVAELYDEAQLTDYLAAYYHRHRNYLHGWLTRLRALETQGKVRLLDVRRLSFGDRYHEAYSVIAWQAL